MTTDTVPLGEVAVRRGEKVHATDGNIGQVQGLVIDPASPPHEPHAPAGGHVFGRKEVAIPIGVVTRAGEDGIQLNITKQQVRRDESGLVNHPA